VEAVVRERVDMRGLGCNDTSGVRLTDVRDLRSGMALAPARAVGAGALSGGKGKMSGLGLSTDMGRGEGARLREGGARPRWAEAREMRGYRLSLFLLFSFLF
jgi:hypothetical protein